MRYIGAVTLTPGTPIKLAVRFPTLTDLHFNSIVIAQKRGNTGFVYVGSAAMTGEATASVTIPPASASAVPYVNINLSAAGNPLNLGGFAVDGSAAEVVQVSVLVN